MDTNVKTAIQDRKTLIIRDGENNVRTIEPYALFMGKQEILVHCFQTAGHSSSGAAIGWKNIKLSSIVQARAGLYFKPRPEFNPGKFKCL